MTLNRRRSVVAGAGIALASAGLLLAGCAAFTPQTVTSPYEASDGANAQIGGQGQNGGVKLRNMLIVGSAKGAPALLVGAIANGEREPVEIQLSVQSGAGQEGGALGQAQVTAEPGVLTPVGTGDGELLRIDSLPQAPGSMLTLVARTPEGSVTLEVPVLAAQGEYASLTPSPSATGSPSATPSPVPSGTETASPSPTSSD